MINYFSASKKIRVWEDDELEKQKTRINLVAQFSSFLNRDRVHLKDYQDISHCLKALVEDQESNWCEMAKFL
jgi:hypothetical protein